WTGLTAEELDHVVAGSRGVFPFLQMFVVVKTRQPYNVSTFSEKLTGGKKDDYRGQPLYRFQPSPAEGFLWCATERVFVLAVWVGGKYEEVRARIPANPAAGVAGL